MDSRTSFDSVTVASVGSSVTFSATVHRSVQSFRTGPLLALPSRLDGLIVAKVMDGKYSMFIDYEAFFESALGLLNDDVLEPFLANLKDHLMDVQVALGKIDTWWTEP